MADTTLVTALLVLPAVAAVFAALAPLPTARTLAATAMLVTLAFAVSLVVDFAGTPVAVTLGGLPALGVEFLFGLDSLNVYFVLLTAILFPAVLACAWTTREGESRLWLSLTLALQAALFGTFLARDLVVLFVMWEAVLIPMVLAILVFGGAQRRRAAMGFFLYTMAGSVLFLAAVIVLGAEAARVTGRWTYRLDTLYGLELSAGKEMFVFVALALACAVKSPVFPFHAWLPLAYREASPTGTALMAGVLSKMGAYGFLVLAVPLCPNVAPRAAPYVAALAVASILYGAVLALRQRQYKDLVAYASLSHMGYIVLGIFAFEVTSLQGALFQVLSHGLAVAGLFLLLGLLEQRRGAGWPGTDALAARAPRFAVVLMLFVLASLALPLTSGFTAEFLVLMGSVTRGLADVEAGSGGLMLVVALLACTGVVLGATYMLRFARALVFGDASARALSVPDLSPRELLAVAPLLVLILWIGVWPASLIDKTVPAFAQAAPAAVHAAAVAPQGGGR
ncbi:MAG: NADH-quinone oxidoreductase subunit M [Burkholderiales bacterium]